LVAGFVSGWWRQVKPLRKELGTLNAWITGQRKDQSPGTRMEVPTVQVDPAFEGKAGGAGSLIKYNPLTNMTGLEVWAFLRQFDVPVNAMHEMGYVSIGCEPCTRPVLPGQQEREGRWWWEDAAAKECGLHSGNISETEGEVRKQTHKARTAPPRLNACVVVLALARPPVPVLCLAWTGSYSYKSTGPFLRLW